MKKRCFIPSIIVLIAVIIGILLLLEYRMSQIRSELSIYSANTAASSAVTRGVDEVLNKYKLKYDDVVNLTYGSDGCVKSVTSNAAMLNRIGNEIGSCADNLINNVEVHTVKIPVSTLIGGEMLNGTGPKIPLKFTMTAITSTRLKHSFDSAGVNQTWHRIILEVTVKSYVMYGGKVTVIKYSSDVCVAESIIVGITPNTFAQIQK